MNYPVSYSPWAKGPKGFEVKDQCNNRICSDVKEADAKRIALCLNFCADLSNDDLLKVDEIKLTEVKS